MATEYISRRSMVGNVFGDLTVIGIGEHHKYPNGDTALWWKCVCKCGKECVVDGRNLRSGKVKSCGCMKTKMLVNFNSKHGGASRHKEKRLYTIWRGGRMPFNALKTLQMTFTTTVLLKAHGLLPNG